MDYIERILVAIGIFLLLLTGLMVYEYVTGQPQKQCINEYGTNYTYYQDNKGGMFCKAQNGTLKPF